MSKKMQGSVFVQMGVGVSLLLALSGCSGSDAGNPGTSGGNSSTGTGGSGGIGGTPAGGAPGVSGSVSSGGVVAAGGVAVAGGTTATGGTLGTGGVPNAGGTVSTGGSKSTGGTTSAGGTIGTGGSSATGGTVSTGGSKAGGGTSSTGGTKASGGTVSTGGSKAVGGTAGTGGSKATGGAVSTGGSTGTNSNCPGADPTEFALVQAWLNNTTAVGALPNYAYSNIKTNFPAGTAFNKLACSIAMSCVEFAPMEANWLRKCEAVLTSAIVAESSYNPISVVNDAYGGTADPTVGLLQIRFSSTVHDFNYYGPMAKMAAIGCSWPSAVLALADTTTIWRAQGANYLSFMQDVACNIGLAAWYYFYNATGNGGASAVWISNYCAGQGIAGTMVVGLLSHLQGGSYARPPDANNAYPWGIECCSAGNPSSSTCTGCTGRFAAFMGIGTTSARPSPDPFQEALAPEPTKYCK